jgi:hypothetical protein
LPQTRHCLELARTPQLGGLETLALSGIRPPVPSRRRSNWNEHRPHCCSARR